MEKERPDVVNEAIEKAILHPGNHSCRNDPDHICKVTQPASEDLLFVDNKKFPQCPYYLPFGYSGFCNFAARKELYKKYNV